MSNRPGPVQKREASLGPQQNRSSGHRAAFTLTSGRKPTGNEEHPLWKQEGRVVPLDWSFENIMDLGI